MHFNQIISFLSELDLHILNLKIISGICILLPYYFFNFKVMLLSKVFTVDVISQEKKNKKFGTHFWGSEYFWHNLQISWKLTRYQRKISSLYRVRSRRWSNMCEYVAVCVDTEDPSTIQKRRKEIRQRKDYTWNTTQLLMISAQSEMLHVWWGIVGDIFCKQVPTASSIEIDFSHWIS